jgi:hypothetical protein
LIAVLGSELDAAARDLVDGWAAEGGVFISAKDLCTRGWISHASSCIDGSFVASAMVRPTAALHGVVVRRPAIAAEELPWIAREDRQYVAAEINAFLVAWLSALTCPVINRPTATSLCGPAWTQTHWKIAGARAGIVWSDSVESGDLHDVVFCRGLHHGAVSREQILTGIKLTEVSGADLIGVRFRDDNVAAVTLQPRLAEQPARDMVLACLRAEVAA